MTQPWFAIGCFAAIALFGTVCSLSLQRFFGNHIALIAAGPLICVGAVLTFIVMYSRDRSNK